MPKPIAVFFYRRMGEMLVKLDDGRLCRARASGILVPTPLPGLCEQELEPVPAYRLSWFGPVEESSNG